VQPDPEARRSFPVLRSSRSVSRTRLNMLKGYAPRRPSVVYGKQRRPDSGSLNFRQERISRGTWQHAPHAVIHGPRYAEVRNCHDVLS